jgi:hypothetical protein
MDLSHFMNFTVQLPFWFMVVIFGIGFVLGLTARMGSGGVHR